MGRESELERGPRTPLGREEPLALLLPGAAPELVAEAERLAGFLRLLASDARARHASELAVDLGRARGELEHRERRRLARGLGLLLGAHLAASLEGATFLDLGPRRSAGELEEAWAGLLEARGLLGPGAGLPAPGEAALDVARRLLAVLEALLARGAQQGSSAAAATGAAGWRARLAFRVGLARAERGPAAAEALCLGGLEELGARAPAAARAPLVAAVAALRLDRAAVREADLWLREHRALAAERPELAWLPAWARLLAGDEAGARRLLRPARPRAGALPAALVELREARPEWLPLLAGRAPSGGAAGGSPALPPGLGADLRRARVELGAAALGICAFEPGAGRAVRGLELAPGLRGAAQGWIEGRSRAHALPSEPEHRVLVEARPVVLHRREGGALRGALGAKGSRALALSPILDGRGDVEGWVHLECDHHLLPPRAALGALAQLLRPHLSPAGGAPGAATVVWPAAGRGSTAAGGSPVEGPLVAGPPAAAAGAVRETADPTRALCGRVFEALVRALAMKTRERRWWGLEVAGEVAGGAGGALELAGGVGGGALRLVAEGGEGLPGTLQGLRAGGGRALRRALASSGVVTFEEPDRALALHAGAASGAVVPLCVRGRCVGLFAVESRRRRDLGPAEAERLRSAAAGLALALRVAQMRSWHQETHGFDLHVDTSLAGLRAVAERVAAAGRSGEPAVVVGPPGAGKLVLARWLHFEGGGEGAPLHLLPLGLDDPRELLLRLDDAGRGSVLLEPLEKLPAPLQEALLARLEHGADPSRRGARLFLVAGAAPRELAARGLLRPDLAARLSRLVLFVPPLADRREELVGLVPFLAQRFAREEGSEPPRLSEAALALLWRQPWPGNVRQLESLVFELSLLHAGGDVDVAEVREAARRLRQPLLSKIPSRHPRRRDLVAALRSTRKKSGRANKTRAAAFLGWDPDTLVARLSDAHLAESDLDGEPWGW